MNNSIARLQRIAVIALAALALVACTRSVTSSPNEPKDLEKWVKDTREKPGQPLKPLEPIAPFETFVYQANNLPDPFDLQGKADSLSSTRPDSGRRRQPLEAYPLDALKMVGTLGRGNSTVALIMAPDKVAYRVHTGAYIGQNEGRVTLIREDHIELVELQPDGAGGWLQRNATISLNQ